MIRASNIFVYILFCLLIAAAVFNRFFQPKYFDFSSPISASHLILTGEQQGTASRIFDARLDQYKAVSGDIKTLLYSMVIIVAISLYMTITRRKEFELPFIGGRANAVWLRWACPIILTCLWLYFGYALYSSMLSRTFLLDLGKVIETSLSSVVSSQEPLKYSVEDGGIGDFIFYLYSPAYATTRDSFNAVFSWLVFHALFGTLLGVVHGSIMAGALSWMRVAVNKTAAVSYLGFTSLLLIGSHLSFSKAIPTLWTLDIWICATGIVTFYFLPTALEPKK